MEMQQWQQHWVNKHEGTCFLIDMSDFPVCFTVCLFISPDLDGYRAPRGIRAQVNLRYVCPQKISNFLQFGVSDRVWKLTIQVGDSGSAALPLVNYLGSWRTRAGDDLDASIWIGRLPFTKKLVYCKVTQPF